jgi:hypothetical protein
VSSLVERAYGVDNYVPIDAQDRAEDHRSATGIARGWPIPLTRVGEPSAPAGFRRGHWRPKEPA